MSVLAATLLAALAAYGQTQSQSPTAGNASPAPADAVAVLGRQDSGLATFVTAKSGGTIPVTRPPSRSTVEPLDFLEQYGSLFGIADPVQQLIETRQTTDALGQTHTTFEQVHEGIPVFSGVLKVHQDSQGQVLAANGHTYAIPAKLNTTPTLDVTAGVAQATALLTDVFPTGERSELVVVDPGWYGDASIGPHLAYYVILSDLSVPMREAFFIDAHTGAVLDRWDLILTARDREVYNGNGGSSLPGTLVRSEGDPPVVSPADVNRAYDYAGDVYDYYWRAFGRDSIDDAGLTMVLTVNSTAPPCPNAFWNSVQMVFCSGTVTDDVTAHEITHGVTEHTANLIYQNQPGQLNESYSDVFGEMIDLFNGDAAFVGTTGVPPNWPVHPTGPGLDTPNDARSACSSNPSYPDGVRWLLGEDATAFGGAIRDMWDPTCKGDPDRANSPLQTCDSLDNGGVHSGSGIPNHAFAILTDGKTFNGQTVTGIGPIKAAAVWYRALSVYLTPASDFKDAYLSLNQAAADLIGTTPNDPRTGAPSASMFTAADAAEVDKALLAVEMDTDGACGATIDILNPVPPDQCSPRVTVYADDFESGVNGWTFSITGAPDTPYDWGQVGSLPFGRAGTAWFCLDFADGCPTGGEESAIHSLFSPNIVMPASLGQPAVAFTHYIATEPGYDGGNVKIRVNGGAWLLIPASAFLYNPYNTTINGGDNTNPMANEAGWSGAGGQWGTSLIDLSGYVTGGETIQIRFDFGKDYCNGVDGWYVDDFEVYICTCDVDEDCDDGQFCTGTESCVGGFCQTTGNPCGTDFCDEDADACLPAVFWDDFENGNAQGWDLYGPNSTASTGDWIVGNPNGTFSGSDPAQPEDPYEGAGCAFTAQNSDLGIDDVDNGVVYLVSPTIDLSSAVSAELSFVRWFYQRDIGDDANDFYRADASDDNGTSWVNLETLGSVQSANSWTTQSFTLENYVTLNSTVKIRFGASDGTTDGDIVEAAIDNVLVQAFECTIDAQCADDGAFCNGVEYCGPVGVCASPGDPCAGSEWCDESGGACVAYGDGDFDFDTDVDLKDFSEFQMCFGQPAAGACLPGNLTGADAMIDLADFDEFVSVLAGP